MSPILNKELNSLYLPKAPADTKVVVAMSGGVDSSVVAALLKEQGYDVVGITLQLYDHGEAVAKKGACCAGQDIHDARRVSEKIDIPHYVLNYEKRFADTVINSFADSYMMGETPVPCITCNQTVKFNDLLGTAKDLDADALATGHYIQSRPGPHGMELYRAADPERDQSYFLFATTPEQLSFVRFPLGHMHKPDVRKLAEKYGLQVATKSDSQDICFVPTGRYTQIIQKLRPDAAEPGNIVHMNGEVLGTHEGIINYTIGQRRGIGIATGDPLYVIRMNSETREVIVGPRDALKAYWIILKDTNWLGDTPIEDIGPEGIEVFAKIRSTRPPEPATLYNKGGVPVVRLHLGENGVSPGQACVFYDSEEGSSRILGGGWIQSANHSEEDVQEKLSAPVQSSDKAEQNLKAAGA